MKVNSILNIPLKSGFSWPAYWDSRTPTNLIATTNSDSQIDLSWTNGINDGYDGIKIYISTDGITYTLHDTIGILESYSATGLVSSTLYFFKVAAYKGSNYVYSNMDCNLTLASSSLIAEYKFEIPDEFTKNGSNLPMTMNNLPSSIYREGVTYVAYAGYGSYKPNIMTYTHATGVWSDPVEVAASGNDDHGSPAILIDDLGYIHMFFGCHATDLLYSKSDNPLDISAWTAQTPPSDDATYPNVLQLDNGTIYLFYRTDTGANYVYRTSIDRGANWSAETVVFSNGGAHYGMYLGYRKGNGNKIHAFGHDTLNVVDSSAIYRYSEYYFYFDGTNWKNSTDGTLTLPLSLTDAEDMTSIRVYDSGDNITGFPVLDLDDDDNPSFIFVEGEEDLSVNITYKYAKKTGATWSIVEITNTNDILQRSILINKSATELEAYLTRGGSGTGAPYNYGGFIEKWESSDSGATWTKSTLVTNKSLWAFLQYVENAHVNLRFVFAEVSANLNGNPYLIGTEVKICAYGDSGFLGKLGATLYDSSQNKLRGTIPTSPTLIDGKYGKGYSFPGGTTYQYLKVADNAKFTFGNAGTDVPFSISFWLKSDSTAGTQFIISKENAQYEWRVDIATNVIRLLLFKSDVSAFIYATAPHTDTTNWNFYCMTYDGSKNESGIKIYINTTESQTVQTHSGTYQGMSNTAMDVFIGNNKGSVYELNGDLDEMRIWNKVLSLAEMTKIMNNINL